MAKQRGTRFTRLAPTGAAQPCTSIKVRPARLYGPSTEPTWCQSLSRAPPYSLAIHVAWALFGSAARTSRKGFSIEINTEITDFIVERDSFHLAMASVVGQPYVQHRG